MASAAGWAVAWKNWVYLGARAEAISECFSSLQHTPCMILYVHAATTGGGGSAAVVFPLGLWILVIVCNCRYCAEKYPLGNAAVVFNFNYDGARLFETIFPPLHLFCCTLLLGWESYLSRKGWHMLT